MGEPSRAELAAGLRWELVLLWSDMAEARRAAHKGCWSVGCEAIAERIQDITRLVGPVSCREVPMTLFRAGEDAFERVHAEIGITVPPEDIEAGREACARYLGSQGAPHA